MYIFFNKKFIKNFVFDILTYVLSSLVFPKKLEIWISQVLKKFSYCISIELNKEFAICSALLIKLFFKESQSSILNN